MVYSLSKTNVSLNLRYGATLVNHGRLWSKAPTNFPLAPLWYYATQTSGGSQGSKSLAIVSPMLGLIIYIGRVSNVLMIFGLVKPKIPSHGHNYELGLILAQ